MVAKGTKNPYRLRILAAEQWLQQQLPPLLKLESAGIRTQHNRFQRVSKACEDSWSNGFAQRRAPRSEAGLLCCNVSGRWMWTARYSEWITESEDHGSDPLMGDLFLPLLLWSQTLKMQRGESLQKDPHGQTLLRMESNFLYYYCGNDDSKPRRSHAQGWDGTSPSQHKGKN